MYEKGKVHSNADRCGQHFVYPIKEMTDELAKYGNLTISEYMATGQNSI